MSINEQPQGEKTHASAMMPSAAHFPFLVGTGRTDLEFLKLPIPIDQLVHCDIPCDNTATQRVPVVL